MKKLFWYLLAIAIALVILIANSFYAFISEDYHSFVIRGIAVTLSFIVYAIFYHKKGKSTLFYVTAGLLGYVAFSLIGGTFYKNAHIGYKLTFFAPWVGLFFGWLFNNAQKIKTYWKVTFLAIYLFLHYTILFDIIFYEMSFGDMAKNKEVVYDQNLPVGILRSSDTLFVKDLKSEINIFHFWNSGCGSCKYDMGLYPDILLKLKGRATIYPANAPLERDSADLFFRLEELGNLNSIIPIKGFGIKKTPLIDVKIFPSAVVLDNQGNMIYVGELRHVLTEFK